MIEFFNSIGQWFIINKNEIVLFFTSGSFITTLMAVISFMKQRKISKEAVVTNKELGEALTTAISSKKTFDEVEEEVKQIEKDIVDFKDDVHNTLDMLLLKVNAVVEVQSIVYSTLKDESMRKNVNGILTDAKYAETSAKAALAEEIEKLKQNVNCKIKDVKDVIEATTEKVKKTVSSTTKPIVPRC